MGEQKSGGLSQALRQFQSEIESIERTSGVDFTNKDGRRTKYDYVDLAAVLDYVLPKLSKNGLVLMTTSVYNPIVKTETQKKTDGTEVVTSQVIRQVHGIEASVTHVESGESIKETCYFEHEAKDIKDLGAQLTYKWRYAIFTLLCLSAKGEDDDAGSGGQPKAPRAATPDPERRPAAKAPEKKPGEVKKTDAEIKAEFDELGLNTKEVQLALQAVGINTMAAAIKFRRKYETTEQMMSGIEGNQ